MSTEFTPGERMSEMTPEHEPAPGSPGIWSHLGWRRTKVAPGFCEMEWEPTTDHAFPAGEGWIVHGGMVTALLDTAMGGATWSLLNKDEVFLTGDLRTEFYRPTFPGLVRAEGRVVHKTRRDICICRAVRCVRKTLSFLQGHQPDDRPQCPRRPEEARTFASG